jgi:hypothetical protein
MMQEFDLPKVYNWEKASTKIPTIYKAILTQTGTADPVVTILENTLKTNVIWTRDAIGVYYGTLEGGEFNTSTFVLTSLGSAAASIIKGFTNPSQIVIFTLDTGHAVDLVGTAYIEVQVYI